MKIQVIKLFQTYSTQSCSALKPDYRLQFKQLPFDTVSFGSNTEDTAPENNKSQKNYYKRPFVNQNRTVDIKGAQENLKKEHEKARLKKNFITSSLGNAISNNLIPEKKLKQIINNMSEYPDLIEELFFEPKNGDLMLKVSDSVMQKILSHTHNLSRLALTEDAKGNIFVEKASPSKIRIFNDAAKNNPELLEKVYTHRNRNNQVPAHYIDPESLKSMNKVLLPYPWLLNAIYTSQDKRGNTPMYNRFQASHIIIKNTLHKFPATLKRVTALENKYGERYDDALLKAKRYSGPYERTWNYILTNG